MTKSNGNGRLPNGRFPARPSPKTNQNPTTKSSKTPVRASGAQIVVGNEAVMLPGIGPLSKRVERYQRKIAGRVVLDLSRSSIDQSREYILHRWQGDLERALDEILRGHDGICGECNKPCGHATNDSARMRAIEGIFKIAGVLSPDIQINMLQALGVANEQEARQLLERGREMVKFQTAEVPLERYREMGLELLEMVLSQRPEWRGEIVARLDRSFAMPEVE